MATVGNPLERGLPTSILCGKFVEEWGGEESEALVSPEEGVDIARKVKVAGNENEEFVGETEK